jgi:transcriptional regulator with XRE-family HTH domain
MLTILRSAVRMSQLSNREVERRLGWSTGYLSRLFAEDMDLRVEHILDVCRALDFPPSDFFRVVYMKRDDPDKQSWAQTLAKVHPLLEQESKPAQPAATSDAPVTTVISKEEVDQIVMNALRKLLLGGLARVEEGRPEKK